jgi:predicted DNA-binding protein (MmcQ/YjbR family)
MKHTFDKITLKCDQNKSKQFSEKPKYLQKPLLHKKMWNKTTVSWLLFM